MRQYDFIFGYARLSDDDDDKKDESNSIKNQKLLIRQYIQSREDLRDAGVEFCVDDGFSGTNYDRPGFQKMMEMVKSRPHSIIIVKDLARLGRDTVDTQNYIEKVFPFMQVRFIAVNDGYDSDDPVARRKDSEAKFKNLVNGIYPQICSQNVKQAMRKQAEAMGLYRRMDIGLKEITEPYCISMKSLPRLYVSFLKRGLPGKNIRKLPEN